MHQLPVTSMCHDESFIQSEGISAANTQYLDVDLLKKPTKRAVNLMTVCQTLLVQHKLSVHRSKQHK